MADNDDIMKDDKQTEEELLDFDFDDLEDIDLGEDEASGSDDEILDLSDIVEPGDLEKDLADDLDGLMEDEKGARDVSEADASDLFSDEFAKTVEAKASGGFEDDLDAVLDTFGSSEEEEKSDAGAGAAEPDDITQLLDDDIDLGEDAITEEDLDIPPGGPDAPLEPEQPESEEADFDIDLEGLEVSEGPGETDEARGDVSESGEIRALLEDEALESDMGAEEISDLIPDEFAETVETETSPEPELEPKEAQGEPEEAPTEDSEADALDQLLADAEEIETSAGTEEPETGEGEPVMDAAAVEEDLGAGDLEAELGTALEGLEGEAVEEIEEEAEEGTDLEELSPLEEPLSSGVEPEETGAVDGSGDGAGTPELPPVDLGAVPPVSGPEAPPVEAPASGLSEARVEALIREVVQEVLERVARETMTEVAERVIGEAIDALKKSLEVQED